MNLRLILFAFIIGVAVRSFGAVTITGSRVVQITPAAITGLEAVYVVENAADASLTVKSSSSSAKTLLSRFSALGGGYAEPIVETKGGTIVYKLPAGDMGYIVEENGRQTAYWIVDYATHRPDLSAIAISADSDCDRVVFDATGAFERIMYYSVTGAPNELNREIKLEYNNLELKESNDEENPTDAVWTECLTTVTFPSVQGTFSTQAPLCNTTFTLTGDRFLTEWGDPVILTTPSYTTKRVDAKTWATQAERENDNESGALSSGLGGSAPCDITFTALPTDAAVFHEWQFSATEDFEDVMYRFTEETFTYTFTEYGTTYVRFVCADASGDCMFEGEVYTVTIGESKLQCPNAFSPQNQDGVNDEWKVSYSSLVSYECHIFNRWGKELFSSTNPAEGWDGRVGGKFIPSGVYFYVIKAEGADGKKYNLSGDINVVGSKLRPTSESTE